MAADDRTDALGSLDGILGLHLRLAHGAVQRHFGEQSATLGLTQKQISVLWLVEETGVIAQTDLARRLQMDRATTMAVVHTLERRALVTRVRDVRDARRVGFSATAAGLQTLEEARAAIAAHETWLCERFSADERATLADLLRRIHG